MKKIIFFSLLIAILASCHDQHKEAAPAGEGKTTADSLMDQVMEGHDVGMGKYGKMKGLKNQIDAALDSISKLPAKAREEAAPYVSRLRVAGDELGTAISQMDQWMENFNMDSALNNMEQRVRYLTEEKDKVGKVKDLILRSVANADSLLKK